MEAEPETANEATATDPLAGRLAEGDPAAPREMVERHLAELLRYATDLLRDAAPAEDTVQEAYRRAFDAPGRYPEGRIRSLSLRAWLYKITLNLVRNDWRGEGHEVPAARIPEGPGIVSSAAPEARLDVLDALGILPDTEYERCGPTQGGAAFACCYECTCGGGPAGLPGLGLRSAV